MTFEEWYELVLATEQSSKSVLLMRKAWDAGRQEAGQAYQRSIQMPPTCEPGKHDWYNNGEVTYHLFDVCRKCGKRVNERALG